MKFLTSFGMTGSDLMGWGGKPGRFAGTFLQGTNFIQNAPASLPLHFKCTVIPNGAKTELAKFWRNEESSSKL